MEDNFSKEILRGNINIAILKALEEGDKYGYEIGRYIEAKVGGDFKLKEPTLYSCLKRLESRKLVESYWSDEDSRGGRRKYFRLTDYGKQVCASNITDWRKSKPVIDKIVSGDDGSRESGYNNSLSEENAVSGGFLKEKRQLKYDEQDSSKFSRNAKMFPNEDEEINPEYRTILSKLLRNVKNEIDLSVKGAGSEAAHSEKKNNEVNSFEETNYGHDLKNRPANNGLSFKKNDDIPLRGKDWESADAVLLNDRQEENFSLLPSSSDFNFVAIQRTMASQGFTLKPYSPENNLPKQFLLVNRINMLTSLLLFLVAAIQTATIYYFWEPIINIGLKYYVYILTVMLVIPIISSLVYLFNPIKRTKKRYNVFYSIISSIMMFIVCFLGILSIALLFNIDITNHYEMIVKLYIPTIYASNFVFYSIIWAILYKAKCCRY